MRTNLYVNICLSIWVGGVIINYKKEANKVRVCLRPDGKKDELCD